MAQNEVKATASLDTRPFEQGTARMGDNLKKFAFETEGVMSKLARQLSLTDLAAAAVFAGIQKLNQIASDSVRAFGEHERKLRDTGKAYDEIVDRLDAINGRINSNNREIGEALTPLEEYRKRLELIGSNALVSVAKGFENTGKAFSRLPGPVQMLIASSFAGGTGMLGTLGNLSLAPGVRPGIPDRYGYRPTTATDVEEYEAQKRLAARRGASGGGFAEPRVPRYQPGYPRPIPMGGNPFDMGYLNGQPGVDMREPARYSEGTPGAFSTFEDYQKYVERMEKVNQITQQFGQNLVSTLFDTFSRGQNVMKAIGNVIVDTLKSALSEIAGQAIGSALSGFLGGALGIKPGVSGKAFSGSAVEPAMQRMAARSIMPGLAYETRRGRGF